MARYDKKPRKRRAACHTIMYRYILILYSVLSFGLLATRNIGTAQGKLEYERVVKG